MDIGSPFHLMIFIFIIALIGGSIIRSVKFCLAWYFAFHFAKKFRRLPPHLQPPGWSGHKTPQP